MKSAFCKGWVSIRQIFTRKGRPPPIIFYTDRYANECLTTLSLTVFTQRNFVADFLKRNAILHGNRPFCAFEALCGGLGETYDAHLRLGGKRVVDFLLLIEHFSLAVTAEALRANIG